MFLISPVPSLSSCPSFLKTLKVCKYLSDYIVLDTLNKCSRRSLSCLWGGWYIYSKLFTFFSFNSVMSLENRVMLVLPIFSWRSFTCSASHWSTQRCNKLIFRFFHWVGNKIKKIFYLNFAFFYVNKNKNHWKHTQM